MLKLESVSKPNKNRLIYIQLQSSKEIRLHIAAHPSSLPPPARLPPCTACCGPMAHCNHRADGPQNYELGRWEGWRDKWFEGTKHVKRVEKECISSTFNNKINKCSLTLGYGRRDKDIKQICQKQQKEKSNAQGRRGRAYPRFLRNSLLNCSKAPWKA